jgi:hypothetical protein
MNLSLKTSTKELTIMGRAKDFIDATVTNEGKADKTGYIESLSGWSIIITKASENVQTGLDKIERALKSEDPDQVKRALGFLDSAADRLSKEVENLKSVTRSLLREVEKPDIKDSDFWK